MTITIHRNQGGDRFRNSPPKARAERHCGAFVAHVRKQRAHKRENSHDAHCYGVKSPPIPPLSALINTHVYKCTHIIPPPAPSIASLGNGNAGSPLLTPRDPQESEASRLIGINIVVDSLYSSKKIKQLPLVTPVLPA